jgi:hypothetical protein
MCKKNLNQCKDPNDFIQYAKHKKGTIVVCGKGVKIYGPVPTGYALIHSNHPRELAKGTRMAIIKALIAIGLGVISLAAYILPALAKTF